MSKPEPLSRFALVLRQLLTDRGWSAYRLAQASGVSEGTLGEYLRGTKVPNWATVEKLCDALECSADAFREAGPGPEVIALTKIGKIRVKTALALARAGSRRACLPLLYETRVEGGDGDGWLEQYATREQALTGHERVVALVRSGV
jgi:transcriptional regulator with XRE-family HTH domain